MIIVTGGAGFIGSAMIWKLNQMGRKDVIVVDDLGESEKWRNLVSLRYEEYLNKQVFLELVVTDQLPWDIEGVIHMGACSSTVEKDCDYLMENNYHFSRILCEWALEKEHRFINASSAATYGNGKNGFSDDPDRIEGLKPLNMYAYSKQLFDLWARSEGCLDSIVSLKFFNVFGPNEYHKGQMRSMVCKAFHQIKNKSKVSLFKSYRPDYADGEQERDFIYVKDCVEVLWWLYENRQANGLFNLGSGESRTWNDLAGAVFRAMGKETVIEYVEMPEEIRGSYQYSTRAETARLAETGCPMDFMSLEEAVDDYVRGYLTAEDPYL